MINVRLASAADAEAIQAIYAPVVPGTAISFEEMRGRILATLEPPTWSRSKTVW